MEIQTGHIVRALAGHDSGSLYCVIETEGDFLLLADGKGRKLTQPKRKRKKHVELAGGFGPMSAIPDSDRELRRVLAQTRDQLYGGSKGQGGNHAWQKTI